MPPKGSQSSPPRTRTQFIEETSEIEWNEWNRVWNQENLWGKMLVIAFFTCFEARVKTTQSYQVSEWESAEIESIIRIWFPTHSFIALYCHSIIVPRACKQFNELARNSMSLHAVQWACTQFNELACSSMSLHAVQWACMQFNELTCAQ